MSGPATSGPASGGRPGASRPAAPLHEARRVAGPLAGALGDFTYTIQDAPPPKRPAAGSDKRGRPRRRTRLRTGKIIDPTGLFLTECLIYDRSETGGRLRLPTTVALTRTIHVFEDQSATLFLAEVVWRTGLDAGVRFRPFVPTARSRSLEAAMRRRYYAVKD